MKIFIKGKDKRACILSDDFFLVENIEMSNNQCEWESVIMALNTIPYCDDSGFTIYTDSLLVYRQIQGENKIKDKALKEQYFRWNEMKNILRDIPIEYLYVSGCDNPARRKLCEQ